MFVGIQLIIQT